MKILRILVLPLTLTTGLFGEGILGQDAFRAFEAIEGLQTEQDSNGNYYVLERIEDLPTKVKPGAIIKIKKKIVSPKDPDKNIVIESIANAQEERSSLAGKDEIDKDGVYHVIRIPDVPKNLEFEILLNMQNEDDKYQLYKYWIYAHTFEIEQPGENWTFNQS